MLPRLSLLLLTALVLAACQPSTAPVEGGVIEVHRTAECGCCAEYEEYLASEGFRIRTVIVTANRLAETRQGLGVPDELLSCHTSLIEGYFVEGHVPADDIRRLIDEAPDIAGIALPGMPPGSPGMGGTASGPLITYAVTQGDLDIFGQG